MSATPLRSFFYLLFLGALLLTLALVVDSHLLARKDPGAPMSTAMRETIQTEHDPLTPGDERAIHEQFPGALTTASGLRSLVRVPGSGPRPQRGQTVTVNYEGRLLNGAVFDSSRAHGEPLTYVLGSVSTGTAVEPKPDAKPSLLPGWDEALLLMQKGEKCIFILPPWLAYGDAGHPPAIPPYTTLVMEVELLDIH